VEQGIKFTKQAIAGTDQGMSFAIRFFSAFSTSTAGELRVSKTKTPKKFFAKKDRKNKKSCHSAGCDNNNAPCFNISYLMDKSKNIGMTPTGFTKANNKAVMPMNSLTLTPYYFLCCN